MSSRVLSMLGRPWMLVLWWVALLVLTGCPPSFEDNKCAVDADCFGDEVCSSGGECVANVVKPSVVSFTSDQALVQPGTKITLSWSLEGAASANISAQGFSYTIPSAELSSGSTELTIDQTQTFNLTAINGALNDSKSVVVEVQDVALPVINTFTTSAPMIKPGESVTLSWTATGAMSGRIEGGATPTPIPATDINGGSVTLSPAQTTTYKLIMENLAGKAEQELTVTVMGDAPVITSFGAAPQMVSEGDPITLTWAVTDATALSLTDAQQQVVDITGKDLMADSVEVTPLASTVYTLKATNAQGEVTRQVQVTVNRKLTIESFTATPTMVRPGVSSTLSWQIAGPVTSLEIKDDLGNVIDTSAVPNLSGGSIQVRPSVDTTYTLSATDGTDTVMAMVSVTIAPPAPQITSFSADNTQVAAGDMVTLSWTVTGAASLTLTDAMGGSVDVSALSVTQDSVVVTVNQNTRYTLTATNATGMDSMDVLIQVGNAVVINSFTSTMMSVTQGQMVDLSWDVTNATSISIMASNGTMVSTLGKDLMMDTVTVRPSAPGTTYTLVAEGFAGPVSQTVMVTVTGATVSVDSLSATPNPVQRNAMTTITWTSTGAMTAALSYTNASGMGTIDLTGKMVAGDSVVDSPAEDTTYVLTVTDAFGNTATANVVVTVFDVASVDSFTATPQAITEGESITLAWTGTAGVSATMMATDANGTTAVDLTGKMANGDSVMVSPTIDTTYMLELTDAQGGTDSETVMVTVAPAARITSFTATPATITSGQMSTLTWVAANATSVTMMATDANGTTAVDLTGKMANGDSVTVSPTINTTYALTVSDGVNSPSTNATVTVNAAPMPSITSFTATPPTIIAGAMTTLGWVSANATDVTMTATDANGTTPVDLTGKMAAADTIMVSPTIDTTYTLTATNGVDSVMDSVMVTVTAALPAPSITGFTATPATITSGQMTTLAWTATDGVTATMMATDANGTTAVDLTGKMANGDSVMVSPTINTSYELTVTNATGDDTATVMVTVNAAAAVSITSFTADKMATVSGEAVVLSWQVANGTGVTMMNDLNNPVDLTGKMVAADSVTVFPQATRTYTLSAAGPSGPVTATVTITVSAAPLLITEVMYDTDGADAGFEWVEIHNTGTTFVDLSEYSIGSGGTDYTFAKFGLSGTLAPGACFVVGEGGTGLTKNGVPMGFVYDQVISFGQGMQNGATPADGVGLFFSKTVTAASVPIDAVLWGTANTSSLKGEDGLPKMELSVDVTSVHSLERTSPTSDIFRDQAVPTPGRCFTVTQLATTRSANDASGSLAFTGYGLDFDLVEAKLGTQTLTNCAEPMPGQYTCDVAASMQTGAVDVSFTEINEYVRDANGAAMLQAAAMPQTTQTLTGAFTLEGRLDDPGFDYYCGILDPGMTPTAAVNSPITVEMQVYLAGNTEAGGHLPPGYLVEATYFAPNSVPYLLFGDLGWVVASKARNDGNDAIYAASLTSATAQTAEVAYRVSPDNGLSYYYCDRSGGPQGSENGWDVGGGLGVQWTP